MAKSKLIDKVIQKDAVVFEKVVAEMKKADTPKDEYALPELKEKDKHQEPGHSRRDFRN